jgi:hypothetical protein
MARRSLRPQLNQIRTWVRQGRTDAWIAHQLEVTVQQIQAFKRENDLSPEADAGNGSAGADLDEDVDLRAEDDALIAKELEEAQAEAERKADEEEKAKARAAEAGGAVGEGDDDEKPRRARRGGRRRKAPSAGPLEGTFDHGEEGYGLWLDPAVQDNPVYAEHWAGHRPIEVSIEEDQIVIRRAGDGEE